MNQEIEPNDIDNDELLDRNTTLRELPELGEDWDQDVQDFLGEISNEDWDY